MEDFEYDLSSLEKKDTFSAKCENCGANMVFNPETQELYCSYCGSSKDFAKSHEVSELEIEKAFALDDDWKDDNAVYRCENCGAVVVLPGNQSATVCPYCNTSHVVKSEDSAGLKPGAVYPFTIGRENAVTVAKKWVKSRFFAPKKFKKELSEEKFTGVYEPAFTYDSHTYSTYEGVIGIRRTRTVGSGKNRQVQTYIDWRHISGTFTRSFDDITISASETNSQANLNKIMPFNYDTIKVYDKTYLAGFMAHKSSRSVRDGWDDAKNVIDGVLRKEILSQYYHDTVRYLNVRTIHEGVTYKYVLLPVYIMSFPFRKKSYSICVNGNTGKVTGKTPISILKVTLTVLLSLLAVVGIGLLVYLNGNPT